MQFKVNIPEQEVLTFVLEHEYSHFMHSPMFAKFKAHEDGASITYTGLYKENELVATATLLNYKEPLKGSYIYIPCGFCMDYTDLDVLKEYVEHIVEYAKAHKAVSIKMDPNVIRNHHELDGTLIDDGFSNEYISEELKKLGFIHRGYNYAYDGSKRNRFTLIVDTDKEFTDVLKNMPKSKQNYFKRQSKMAIEVCEGGKELAKELAIYAKELADIQHFTPHDEAYFTRLIEAYGEYGHTYVATINFEKQIEVYQAELDSGKYRKDKEAEEHVRNDVLKTKENLATFGNNPVIGVAFYVAVGDKSYNLFNYINKELTAYRGTDAIHYHVLQDMMKRGVKHYDLVGFSGVVDKNDAYYGLYDYKKTLGPEFIEHIGEFDYIIDDAAHKKNQNYLKFRRVLSRIKHKLFK